MSKKSPGRPESVPGIGGYADVLILCGIFRGGFLEILGALMKSKLFVLLD